MASYKIIEHLIPCQYIREHPRALANSQDDTLQLAVKQYIPIDNPDPQSGDVTIVGAHANGFPKELYEPLWDELIRTSKKYGFRIRSIWISDVAHQGASSVVNENLIGNDPAWFDHSRDLLHMINMKRDQMPRPIVGIGHSMGGAQLANLSYFHPRLFTTLVLIDPVIDIQGRAALAPNNIAQLSTFRRDVWPSRAAAAESFKKSPFYKTWNPQVLDRWIQYGLRDLPTNLHPISSSSSTSSDDARPQEVQVTLTTPVPQEVFTFLRPNYSGYGTTRPVNRATHADVDPSLPVISPFYRAEGPSVFKNLPALRPSTLYLFGGTSTTSSPEENKAKVDRTGSGAGGSGGAKEGRVKGITFEGVGHLVAMEAVERTALETGKWVGSEMQRWRDEQAEWEKGWRDGKSLREKQEIDSKWKEMMGGGLKRKAKL